MAQYDSPDNHNHPTSSFLAPKSPTRQAVASRRSTASLRGTPDEFVPNGQHSLAHELAVALMPEPSASSKLLAEELGIEYDEGAEGIDGNGTVHHVDDGSVPSFADELQSASAGSSFHDPSLEESTPHSSPSSHPLGGPAADRPKRQEQDAMETLAQDLQMTDNFLTHLRTIDADVPSNAALERLASDVIRHINESTKSREDQVRELLEYEREFRKISSELGGSDVLGQLEELVQMDDLVESKSPVETTHDPQLALETVEEEQVQDWEVDPDHHPLAHRRASSFDSDDGYDPDSSAKDFPPPPPINGPPTPRTTIPQLAHLRSFTVSLVGTLTTISEQCQVNGAATGDAGRKLRALKNKLGDWRTDWDSAEKSRMKIERWEAGIVDSSANGPPVTPTQSAFKRVDGREVVQEHLRAFELALSEAATKTQAIMAAS
jgi:hypothetical protein